MVLTKEQIEQQLQKLLSVLLDDLSAVNDFAIQHGIERMPFMDGYINFGRLFGGDWVVDSNGKIDYQSPRTGQLYVPAARGPFVGDSYCWSSSSFDCWPDQAQMKWLFGEDESAWRRTDYHEDENGLSPQTEFDRYPKGLPIGSFTVE